MSLKFSAVIPAYNPGEIVISIVFGAGKYLDSIILIDDGSDARNKEYLKASLDDKVTLITLPENKGKGHALLIGFREALKSSPDYIFTMDSDGQHDPGEIPRFKEFIENSKEPPDLVVGVRDSIRAMPFRSRFGNTFIALLFRMIYGRTISDTQSGFRVFSRGFVEDTIRSVRPGRYETEMRVLAHAVRSRRTVMEAPISTIYIDGNRNSKFRPFLDSARVLSAVLCPRFLN